VLDELGSGLNYKKLGLKKLIIIILSGKVKKIASNQKDRLRRFDAGIIFTSVLFSITISRSFWSGLSLNIG
jgi:predicted site-specific integrase-resolvase